MHAHTQQTRQVGVHSNCIKSANDKTNSTRFEQLREFAKRPEAVALFSGLDFSREIGIR